MQPKVYTHKLINKDSFDDDTCQVEEIKKDERELKGPARVPESCLTSCLQQDQELGGFTLVKSWSAPASRPMSVTLHMKN